MFQCLEKDIELNLETIKRNVSIVEKTHIPISQHKKQQEKKMLQGLNIPLILTSKNTNKKNLQWLEKHIDLNPTSENIKNNSSIAEKIPLPQFPTSKNRKKMF